MTVLDDTVLDDIDEEIQAEIMKRNINVFNKECEAVRSEYKKAEREWERTIGKSYMDIIEEKENEIKKLKERFMKQCQKYKCGEVITMTDGDVAVITECRLQEFYDTPHWRLSYITNKITKRGTVSTTRYRHRRSICQNQIIGLASPTLPHVRAYIRRQMKKRLNGEAANPTEQKGVRS